MRFIFLTAVLLLAAVAQAETVGVPVDHFGDRASLVPLEFAIADTFDAGKPTVFVIADAQQFYVRTDRITAIRDELFGEGLNVVGIVGRGAIESLAAATRRADGSVDWQRAYEIFRAANWVEDIDRVRRHLLGEQGRISLFGQSGGAFLAHQYLATHSEHVDRAITPAAVNPYLETALGIRSDHFWDELGDADRTLARRALGHFSNGKDRRGFMAVLQRQNFFHPADEIAAARTALLAQLAEGDRAAYDAARERYQVNAVDALMDSDRGISIRVRLLEFYAPSPIEATLSGGGLFPDYEVIRAAAEPLIDAHRDGQINFPDWNRSALAQVDTQVLVLAGRHDHTVDYRSSIALAYSYPFGRLLIVRDNHTFDDLKASGHYRSLITSFLLAGFDSEAYGAVIESLGDAVWLE